MVRTASELLALGVAYAAFSRAALASPPDRFDEILVDYDRRNAATECFLRGSEIVFDGLCELRATLRSFEGQRLVVAATDLGSLQMSAVALARCGRRIVTPYWGISDRFTRVAHEIRSVLLDLAAHGPARSLAETLAAAQEGNLLPFLLVEAPAPAPPEQVARRYEFLGLSVRCSRFLSWFAARSRSEVVLVWNIIEPDGRVRLQHRTLGLVDRGATSLLLAMIEAEILRSPTQYAWECAAAMFSDARAGRLALAELPRVVDWRERVMECEPPSGAPSAEATAVRSVAL